MYEAMLKCNNDPNIMSDWKTAITLSEAKELARNNYQHKYDTNQNWKNQYTTFQRLLEVSTYQTRTS